LFSLAEIASIPHLGKSVTDQFHWFNHLLVNTDGTRFTFLNRWRAERRDRQEMAARGFVTRMFTAAADGSDLFCIDESGETSHFIWRDPLHITAFTKPPGQPFGYYVMKDHTKEFERIGEGRMLANGDQTYLQKGNCRDWILCDTYPEGPDATGEGLGLAPSARINTHFPALRSDPMALSGASRRKQPLFPRPPVRPNRSFRSLPQKANS
jgi:hypothetical protein